MYAPALVGDAEGEFAREVRAGLTRAGQKTLPCRYFYDEITAGLPPGPRVREVKIWETDITSATYRPTPSSK